MAMIAAGTAANKNPETKLREALEVKSRFWNCLDASEGLKPAEALW